MATNEAENRPERQATIQPAAHCCKMIFLRKTGGKVIKRDREKYIKMKSFHSAGNDCILSSVFRPFLANTHSHTFSIVSQFCVLQTFHGYLQVFFFGLFLLLPPLWT